MELVEKHDLRIFLDVMCALIGALFHFLFGGWSRPLLVLLVLMAVDYATGTIAAHKNGEYDSSIGKQGVVKKLVYLSLVVVARMIDLLLNLEQPMIQVAAIYGLAGHEIGSFLENISKAGYWVPAALKNGLAQLKQKSGDSDEA